ncbi:MAG: alpha/beta hydrolase [Desulfobacterales bacterium]|nr:alpha/beta hydrolase [Desulfobacterales bacterium]
MSIFVKTVAGIIACYGVYCVLLFLLQRSILFPRNQIPTPPHTDIERVLPGTKKLWLHTDRARAEAWFLPPRANPESSPAPAVIFAHGNGELIDYWPQMLQEFSRMGVGLFLVEYPGYGRSSGVPTQKSITETFVAAYDMLITQKGVDPKRILLLGRSVGCGAICALALKRPAAALILMSTFTSVQSMASKFLVPPFLVRDPFDNLTVIQQYQGPVMLIHGRHDSIIPFDHSARLHKAATNSILIPYDAGHNDCPPDWHQFWKDVTVFLVENNLLKNTVGIWKSVR